MRLRILHNGKLSAAIPHWQLWVERTGQIYGELIGEQSEFHRVQTFEGALDAADADTLFDTAETIHSRFSQRKLLPDDVMVELRDDTHPLWWVAVPPEEQHDRFAAPFFAILKQVLQRYAV